MVTFTVWWDDYKSRDFRTFAGAERFARRTMAEGGGKIAPIEILGADNLTMAWVKIDALDRVWTELTVNCPLKHL